MYAGMWQLAKRVLPNTALERILFPNTEELLEFFEEDHLLTGGFSVPSLFPHRRPLPFTPFNASTEPACAELTFPSLSPLHSSPSPSHLEQSTADTCPTPIHPPTPSSLNLALPSPPPPPTLLTPRLLLHHPPPPSTPRSSTRHLLLDLQRQTRTLLTILPPPPLQDQASSRAGRAG